MNIEHFKAFLWLRWRLRVNQIKRGGPLNAIILAGLALAGLVIAVIGLIGGFFVGLVALPQASPEVRLYVWDGIAIAFVFGWGAGVLTDLQRSESLSLDKFLHLPVSPSGAFFINYLSSIVSLTFIIFCPAMVGLALGEAFGSGALSLFLIPLIAAFFFAATAVTYQFQGWLASLMSNPRRRRTVIVFVTAGMILLFQLPTMLNMTLRPFDHTQDIQERSVKHQEIQRALAAREITPAEANQRTLELGQASLERIGDLKARIEKISWYGNTLIPLGWLPLGAAGLAEGAILPAFLGGLGLFVIGSASLWRAYRTTLRLYQGAEGRQDKKRNEPSKREEKQRTPANTLPTSKSLLMVERVLPWISEQASAVATAGFRALIRAPEVKMILLTPIILVVVFGGMVMGIQQSPPESLRPFIAIGAAMMVLLSSVQFIGNQFGFDRNGFRAYVLSPIPRREILLGKNLSMAPLALSPAAVLILVVTCIYPMRIDHVIGVFVQLAAMFLLTCLLANGMSIAAPIPIPSGSFRPSRVRLGPVLLQLVLLMVYPVVLLPTLIPMGIEILLVEFAGMPRWPLGLILSGVMLAGVIMLYQRILTWQGSLLHRREQAILEIVTEKGE